MDNRSLKALASDAEFRHLIGQRISCTCDGQQYVGIAEFIGVNAMLHGKFQVTIDRTPLWPVDPRTIKLYNK